MGKRGIYRQGYYLALLYALELHYELERRRRGSDPAYWQPLPRKRAGQFLALVDACLAALGLSRPRSYRAFLGLLKREHLGHVATVLHFVIGHRLEQLDAGLDGRTTLKSLRQRLEVPPSSTEQHPQARKFAQSIAAHLDAPWLRALKATYAREGQAWPKVSVILGSLPPGFETVYKQIRTGLLRSEHKELELTITQFYELVMGGPPRPPGLRGPLQQLAGLSEPDLMLLKSLSQRQLTQLSGLTREAFFLILALRSVRQATWTWRELVQAIYRLKDDNADKLLARWKRHYNLDIQKLGAIRQLLQPQTWQQAKSLDDELILLMDKGELGLALFFELEPWDAATWSTVSALSSLDWLWLTSYLEDARVTQQLASLRIPVRLELSRLFPKTTAWLGALAETHIEEILARDLDPVTDYAAAYARRVRLTLEHHVVPKV